MSRWAAAAANSLWYRSALSEGRAFQHATGQVRSTQADYLLQLLRRNAETEIGRRYSFDGIRSVAEFQRRVPLSTYDMYTDAIERIGQGQPRVLSADPVRMLERTSGSTSPSKLIPYTNALKAEFQRAVSAWISDLFAHNRTLRGGAAYWSISPVAHRGERTAAGLPIGFEDDTDYLGGWKGRLIRAAMAVPSQVRLVDEMASFRYITLLYLLRCRHLRLLSVWNPTFLTLLFSALGDWHEQLAADIELGSITPPTAFDRSLMRSLESRVRPDSRRASAIRRAFAASRSPGEVHRLLWPELHLVSCWTEANAAPYVAEVKELFPQAVIQGKGLIATEGFISFPLIGQSGSALAIRSHFYEFLPEEGGPVQLAHELEAGRRYSVVLTTGGGLYRYQLRDRVEVTGHLALCPLLRFLGKEELISDWFGEKVNERHVNDALTEIWASVGWQPRFAMLACEPAPTGRSYVLFLEAPGIDPKQLRRAATLVERALLGNFHYAYCRHLGQLAAVRGFRVERGALETYTAVCQSRGQRAGNIKQMVLHPRDGWAAAFSGSWLDAE